MRIRPTLSNRGTRFFFYILILLITGIILVTTSLEMDTGEQSLSYYTTETIDPAITALSWVVFDADTGEVLFSHKGDVVRPIASITKLATAVAFVRNNDLFATTTITWADVMTDGPAGRLSAGEIYTYQELLFPLLLESSNDAAEVLHRVDPLLIERMDTLVQEIGLTHTAFADSSGLRDNNLSTAHDVALLLRYVAIAHPHLMDITMLPSYINHKNGWINNDPLASDPDFKGGKHGYTEAANRTFAGFFEEEFIGGHVRKIGYVLLGSDDLLSDIAPLRTFVRSNTRLQ